MQQLWTPAKVRSLFNSSGGGKPRWWRDLCSELATYVNKGDLVVEERRYGPAPPPPRGDRSEFRAYVNVIDAPGGEDLLKLRWSAFCWLRREGEPEPLVDRGHLFSEKLEYLVKCGEDEPN